MAQKKNKKKENNSGINVVDPSEMDEKELHELDVKTEEEKEKLEARLAKVNKEIRGKLWLWWIFPIFGWIIYSMIMQSRLQNEENQVKTVVIKREIAEKQIQLMLDQKRWDQIKKKD